MVPVRLLRLRQRLGLKVLLRVVGSLLAGSGQPFYWEDHYSNPANTQSEPQLAQPTPPSGNRETNTPKPRHPLRSISCGNTWLMPKMPDWWRSDAPHWNGRTTVVVSLLTFAAGTIVGALGVHRSSDAPESSTPKPSLQAAAPTEQSGSDGMCSSDSEGQVAAGWGPDRPTYHDDTFPTALTFNSTSDNPIDGDERNFLRIKPTTAHEPSAWADSVEVSNDELYDVRMYIRLDGPDGHTANGAKLAVLLPTCTGHRVGVSSRVSSLDAFPSTVWDGASFWARRDFNLALVPDSGVIYGNAYPGGLPISTNDLVTATGVPLGSRKMDGVIEPGYGGSLYVDFKVRAQVAQ